LSPSKPKDNANALLITITNNFRNIYIWMELPNVKLFTPAFVKDNVFYTSLCSEINETLIASSCATLRFTKIIKAVPPIPSDLAGLYPREIRTLFCRLGKCINNICFAKF
jgi:hypothetical protein